MTTPANGPDDVQRAVNRAADLILDELVAGGPETSRSVAVTDLVNLVANVAAHLGEFPDADLAEAVRAQWPGEAVEDVLDWSRELLG